jgi:isocitrate/isopropylmalate dehydrogenase
MNKTRLAVIPGDGIGKEVVPEALRVLEYLKLRFNIPIEWNIFDWGADEYLKSGIGLPSGAIELLQREYNGIFFGALGDPRIPDMRHGREILLALRTKLNLYVNYRPCPLDLLPSTTRSSRTVEIFRENTQGIYQNIGGIVEAYGDIEVAIDQAVYSRKRVEDFLSHVFYINKSSNKKITLVHKSNAIPNNGRLWRSTFAEIAASYPHVVTNEEFVDAFCCKLVSNPSQFEVVVTSNLFGDIISDIGAALMGGIGLAPSASICPETGFGLFEPVHGSAPDISGLGIGNPVGSILSLSLMLRHFGYREGAQFLEKAIREKLKVGQGTPDIGGTETTSSFSSNLLRLCERM